MLIILLILPPNFLLLCCQPKAPMAHIALLMALPDHHYHHHHQAKAWETTHAGLDKELQKFQKYMKRKAKKIATEEIKHKEKRRLFEATTKLPETRVRARRARLKYCTFGWLLFIAAVFILIHEGVTAEYGEIRYTDAAIAAIVLGIVFGLLCACLGYLKGMVSEPEWQKDKVRQQIKERQQEQLAVMEADVRHNYEIFEEKFAKDVKWQREWSKSQRKLCLSSTKKKKKSSQVAPQAGEGGNGDTESDAAMVQPVSAVAEVAEVAPESIVAS
ncbi:unnamed protein product [Chrysoparadoxa australica]